MTDAGQHKGRPLVGGAAEGEALVLDQALSFAGGVSLASGRIIDVHAPQLGACVAGRILVMPIGRGSSTSSSVLAECIRLGIAPNAIILPGVDQILAVGSLVARILYGRVCPIIAVDPDDHASIRTGAWVTIAPDGTFTTERA
jgi:uncharacterized protein